MQSQRRVGELEEELRRVCAPFSRFFPSIIPPSLHRSIPPSLPDLPLPLLFRSLFRSVSLIPVVALSLLSLFVLSHVWLWKTALYYNGNNADTSTVQHTSSTSTTTTVMLGKLPFESNL